MSRFRRVIHSVISGYANLAVTTLYALVSIPLALHYLSGKEFALWALMSQIGNYLSLIDIGMSGSVARLLIDYKDQRNTGTYGSLIKTGALVTATQGLIAMFVALVLGPVLASPGLLNIPLEFRHEFIVLVRWQVSALGFAFAMRIFTHVLVAHQRMDITNYCPIGGLILNFFVQWYLFHAGYGVYSLAGGSVVAVFLNAGVTVVACLRLKLLPAKGNWGRASWRYFHEMFGYGKDLFLVSLGTQLIVASQTMIITRRLGLEAAGAWAVGTRAFTMVYQLSARIMGFSMPAVAEMIVRQERQKLRERFRDIVILSASLGAFCAVTFAICNSTFVHLISHGKFDKTTWPQVSDLLLGIWMIQLALVSCHNNLVLATKKVGAMRYIYFAEGAVFVVAAWFASGWGGFPAIICCSIVCTATFTCSYGLWRSIRYFELPVSEVVIHWQAPMLRVLGFYVPAALLAWLLTQSLGDIARLGVLVVFSSTVGAVILYTQGAPAHLKTEFLSRTPKPVSMLFHRLFPSR